MDFPGALILLNIFEVDVILEVMCLVDFLGCELFHPPGKAGISIILVQKIKTVTIMVLYKDFIQASAHLNLFKRV